MRVKWLREGLEIVPLSGDVRRRVEEWVSRLRPEDLERLGDYEETGDALACPLVDSRGGLVVRLVRFRGKYLVTAGMRGRDFIEEYFVGEVV